MAIHPRCTRAPSTSSAGYYRRPAAALHRLQHCINGMRGGALIHCLVNPWAGRETELPVCSPLVGERIAVISAGPAGLSYAPVTPSAPK
jgi:hypothetical protein